MIHSFNNLQRVGQQVKSSKRIIKLFTTIYYGNNKITRYVMVRSLRALARLMVWPF